MKQRSLVVAGTDPAGRAPSSAAPRSSSRWPARPSDPTTRRPWRPCPRNGTTAAGEALAPGASELEGWWRRLRRSGARRARRARGADSLDLRQALARVREARALRADRRRRALSRARRRRLLREAQRERQHALRRLRPGRRHLLRRSRRLLGARPVGPRAPLGRSRRRRARGHRRGRPRRRRAGHGRGRAQLRRAALAPAPRRDRRENLALQAQTLELVRARFEAGSGQRERPGPGARQPRSTRSRLPALETALAAAGPAWRSCSGPRARWRPTSADRVPIPVPPLAIAVGVPADLLRRRPDVRRAERLLAAETARIGVAAGRALPAPDALRKRGPRLGRAATCSTATAASSASARRCAGTCSTAAACASASSRRKRAPSKPSSLGAHRARGARGSRERHDGLRRRASAPALVARSRLAGGPAVELARAQYTRGSPTSRRCSSPSAPSPISRTSSRSATRPRPPRRRALQGPGRRLGRKRARARRRTLSGRPAGAERILGDCR